MTRIVALGSCVVDLVFRMSRLPARGETLFADSAGLHPGGKGLNQALAARRLGAQTAIIGNVGDDMLGEYLLRLLQGEGVDVRHAARDAANGTGFAAPIVFPDGGNSILSAPRANLALAPEAVEGARAAIEAADALLLQFEAPMEANLAAARIARRAGTRVVLNPAPVIPHPPELLRLADVLVVNEVEAAMLVGGDDPAAQARALLAGRKLAVVTLGEGGATFATADSTVAHVDAFAVKAIDSVGAGDAFCAALAVALCEGMDATAAMRFASAAGALAVTVAGAATSLPVRAKVEQLLGS